MSIVSVDNIQPIGSGTTVTVNKSVTLESGNTNITGVCTATSFSGSLAASNLTGALPAISGANLTNLPAQATIANNADNRIITGGSGVNLYAEDLLTYDGTTLAAPKAEFSNTAPFSFISNGATGTFNKTVMYANYNNTSNHAYNGILFDMGHLTDSGAGEVRKFTIGERGGPTNVIFDQNGVHFAGGSTNPTINASNGLDEYEEGIFTPTFGASNGSSTAGYSIQTGKYTRIGNIVHVQIYIALSSLSTNSHSHAWISGLPVAPVERTATSSIMCGGMQNSGYTSFPIAGRTGAGATRIELFQATNGGVTDFSTSSVSGTAYFILQCTYRAN